MLLNQLPKQIAIKDQHFILDAQERIIKKPKKIRCHKLLISDGQELKCLAKFSFWHTAKPPSYETKEIRDSCQKH